MSFEKTQKETRVTGRETLVSSSENLKNKEFKRTTRVSAPVKKAVIPAAGRGTRFLPWSGRNAKELIPVIDPKTKEIRAVIDLVVQEAYEASINDILIITALGKSSIQEHLTKQQIDRNIPNEVRIHYTNQREPKGLGDAVLHAKSFVANEEFVVLLGDDFHSKNPVKQLVDAYERIKSPKFGALLTVLRVPDEYTKRYGIAVNPKKATGKIMKVDSFIEKPGKAPSNYAISGRYLLSSKIFKHLEKLKPGNNGEVELTDAINMLGKEGLELYCIELDGQRYDAGTPQGWVNAIQVIGHKALDSNKSR